MLILLMLHINFAWFYHYYGVNYNIYNPSNNAYYANFFAHSPINHHFEESKTMNLYSEKRKISVITGLSEYFRSACSGTCII